MTPEKFQYQITNFRIPFFDQNNLKEILCNELGLSLENIIDFEIKKESLDARQKQKNIFYQYSIVFTTNKKISKKHPALHTSLAKECKGPLEIPNLSKIKERPVIVGYGPSGMFAAYILIEAGIKPIIIEKGQTVDERQKTINRLWRYQEFHEDSNVQFGEGGAGFFSDGKLGTRIKSEYIQKVYEIFVKFGAKESILYNHKPHLGTDKLKGILKNFRNYLEKNGAEFYFETSLTDLIIQNDCIKGIKTNKKEWACQTLFLCTGHSCREIYKILDQHHIALEQKEFAVGFRIEHPQSFINKSQYGAFFDDKNLPAADYKVQMFDKDKKEGVYSFCMCPGGMVVLATSEKEKIVTNGMSLSNRGGRYANAAIVANVHPKEFGADIFSGLHFQEEMEAKAYQLTKSYHAPAQRVSDFLNNTLSIDLPKTSFLPGIISVNLRNFYPPFITDRILNGLQQFNKKIPSFIQEEAILIAPETRTSSPIRICRDQQIYESIGTKGLIPLGEGAGAAGGITSAAIEGINGAMKWIIRQKN